MNASPQVWHQPDQFVKSFRSIACDQSGSKPNLVAKILATKIGNLWA